MNATIVRVAVSGATGRMGRQLIKMLLSESDNYKSIIFTEAITNNDSKFVGSDVGTFVGVGPVGIIIHSSIENIYKNFDVLIDFSSTQASLKYLEFCNIYRKNMVIGTTGFTEEEYCIIKSVAKNIGIVFSPNFSVMMNIMLKLLEKTASIIGSISDINIVESHHRNKQDIPSGTALKIRQSILSFCDNRIFDLSCSEKDSHFNIDIHSIRAGDIIGEHHVSFVSLGESLEIVHRVRDRSIFASGAIRSAEWLGTKKVGLFNMSDVLGL